MGEEAAVAARSLIYGANGYTGRLIARYAAQHGVTPILAGRNASAVVLDHRQSAGIPANV